MIIKHILWSYKRINFANKITFYNNIDDVENNTWMHRDMEYFLKCSTWYLTMRASNEWDIELNTRREIPCLQVDCNNYLNSFSNTKKADLINVLKGEGVAIHSWRLIEQVTCQQLIGYLKHNLWKIIVVFHVRWYVFSQWLKS